MHSFPRQQFPEPAPELKQHAPNPLAVLIEQARSIPTRPLISSSSGTVSYSEALTFARGVAHQMHEVGVRPGQLIALDLPLELHLPFMLATFHEAAISCAYVRSAFQRAGVTPDWLFSLRDLPSDAARRVVKVDDEFIHASTNFEGWFAPTQYSTNGDPCIVFMSSGTTGVPKATAFSVANLMGRSRQIASLMNVQPYMSLLDVSAYVGQTTFMAQLLLGQTYIVPGPASENLAAIRRERVRYLQGSVQQFAALLKVVEAEISEPPKTIEAVQVVGSHMPQQLHEQLVEVLGCEVHARYGTTEGGLASFRLQHSNEMFDAGYVAEGVDIEVLSDDGREVESGVEGALRYRGPFTVPNYYRENPSALTDSTDNWFYPGDRGKLFSDGRLMVTGRDGESVNFGGQKINPALIDEFLLRLDGIQDAAAFAIVDAVGVQQLSVALLGEHLDLEVIRSALVKEFGPLAPRHLHVVDRVPRTEMGKPMRNELSEHFRGK